MKCLPFCGCKNKCENKYANILDIYYPFFLIKLLISPMLLHVFLLRVFTLTNFYWLELEGKQIYKYFVKICKS